MATPKRDPSLLGRKSLGDLARFRQATAVVVRAMLIWLAACVAVLLLLAAVDLVKGIGRFLRGRKRRS
jgi:hypothetical protein